MQADFHFESSSSDSFDISLACARLVAGIIVRVMVKFQLPTLGGDLDAETSKWMHSAAVV